MTIGHLQPRTGPVDDLPALTALRFFPALWVVLYDYWPNLGAAPALVAKGYLGVEVFFILSGFILCHVYLGALDQGKFRYGAFLKARLARIYPLHLASLAAIGAMALGARAIGLSIDPTILSWSSLPANLLLVHAWGLAPAPGWNHPSWSISAEWFAYLLFPLFGAAVLAVRQRPRMAVIASAIILAGLYAAFEAWAGWPLTQATIRWGALRIAPSFAYGCGLYLAWSAGQLRRHVAGAAGLIAAAFFGAAGLFFAHIGAPDAATVLALGAIIPSLASTRPATLHNILGRSVKHLGEVSYAIYMLCVPWNLFFVHATGYLFRFDKAHMPLLAWAILLIALIPLSTVAHYLVERPARSWIRHLPSARPRPLPSVA